MERSPGCYRINQSVGPAMDQLKEVNLLEACSMPKEVTNRKAQLACAVKTREDVGHVSIEVQEFVYAKHSG
jgi:hypothetical protein